MLYEVITIGYLDVSLLARLARKVGVAVARLRLACKCRHEILCGLRSFKTHGALLFDWI